LPDQQQLVMKLVYGGNRMLSWSRILGWLKPATIQSHLIHMVLALVVIQIAVSWHVISELAEEMLHEQIGDTAHTAGPAGR
jgi:hypothetical protein